MCDSYFSTWQRMHCVREEVRGPAPAWLQSIHAGNEQCLFAAVWTMTHTCSYDDADIRARMGYLLGSIHHLKSQTWTESEICFRYYFGNSLFLVCRTLGLMYSNILGFILEVLRLSTLILRSLPMLCFCLPWKWKWPGHTFLLNKHLVGCMDSCDVQEECNILSCDQQLHVSSCWAIHPSFAMEVKCLWSCVWRMHVCGHRYCECEGVNKGTLHKVLEKSCVTEGFEFWWTRCATSYILKTWSTRTHTAKVTVDTWPEPDPTWCDRLNILILIQY